MNVMGLTPPPAIGRGEVAPATRNNEEFPSCFHCVYWVRFAQCLCASASGLTRPMRSACRPVLTSPTPREVTYAVGATSATATSNAVVVTVAEILDVVVTRAVAGEYLGERERHAAGNPLHA